MYFLSEILAEFLDCQSNYIYKTIEWTFLSGSFRLKIHIYDFKKSGNLDELPMEQSILDAAAACPIAHKDCWVPHYRFLLIGSLYGTFSSELLTSGLKYSNFYTQWWVCLQIRGIQRKSILFLFWLLLKAGFHVSQAGHEQVLPHPAESGFTIN